MNILNKKHQIHLSFYLLAMMFSLISCSAQNTKKIAGQYEDGSSVLCIFEDNTYMVGAVHAMSFGTVELNGNELKLIPYQPKHPFALYGRKEQGRLYGNTIMFQGFEHGNGLVNLNENNISLDTMQRVFNEDANCTDWPNFYDNGQDAKTIYLAEVGSQQVFKFELPEGYRDFVAFQFEDQTNNQFIQITVSKDFNSIQFGGEKELIKKPLSKEALETKEMVSGMYERVYPKGKYYYCNPAYNMFEESGIDIKNYEEFGRKGEGIFKLKGLSDNEGAYSTIERLSNDYHDPSIVFQYTKIEPIIIHKTNYKVKEQSIFIFNCPDRNEAVLD